MYRIDQICWLRHAAAGAYPHVIGDPGATTSVQFHYDYRGRRDYVLDQNGNKTTYGYDDADRVTSVTDAQSPSAGVTTYGYDTEDHLTDIWDASQNHTQFVYCSSFLCETIFPSGLMETYSPNSVPGLLNSKTDRNGTQFNYYYDAQNRLMETLEAQGNGGNITYVYDAAGRTTQVQDNRPESPGTYNFGYDNMSRLTSATTNYSFTSLGNLTVGYGYDAASNRTSMTDPQETRGQTGRSRVFENRP